MADFRSDTVTRPTAAMRAAMASAVVGDDVFGDDPTVRELEALGATLLGMEESLFLPSGTMANQVAMRVACRPGDEVLLHEDCHVFRFEQGGLAALHGIQGVPLAGDGGEVPLERFRRSLRGDDPHLPRSRAVVLESSHNMAGGRVLPLGYVKAVREFCSEAGLHLHLDGARALNAAVALGVPCSTVTASFDSATLCLSKGIGAPVGTLLGGSQEFVLRARRARKLLGGGLRQSGVLAAPALVALADAPERLALDHARARRLADGISSLGGLSVLPVETNIVVVSMSEFPVESLLKELRERRVLAIPFGPTRLRFTTHRDVGDDDIDSALDALRESIQVLRSRDGERSTQARDQQ